MSGPTYSYGRTGTRHATPTASLETAHREAQRASRLYESWSVHEYPPGPPQPGKLIATYRNGELVAGEVPS